MKRKDRRSIRLLPNTYNGIEKRLTETLDELEAAFYQGADNVILMSDYVAYREWMRELSEKIESAKRIEDPQ